ncbi:hypothetical protein SASPL_110665 [Salvia splendens]|uniref:Naphthoate synthase n=1 Tax=Salvia splendens TaxID=180675 RepID=A0A8X8Y9B5_SALSN|nr:hypothetical protein SASPL_110665 [Salvia splendens]
MGNSLLGYYAQEFVIQRIPDHLLYRTVDFFVEDSAWAWWKDRGHRPSYHEVESNGSGHAFGGSKKMRRKKKDFLDIIRHKIIAEGIAKITINRPERRNAFRPQTVKELMRAFNDARDDNSIGVIIFTGKGTKAFCSGGDQSFRGKEGYADYDSFGRLNHLFSMLLLYLIFKYIEKKVAGYAVGGGHVLHMVCDLTIAADNAVFGQTGPKVGSVDAGYGASVMDRLVGPKRAREMWFMAKFYNAVEADKMGLVNTVVPLEKLEEETVKWCREILRNSPMAIRVAKSALNAVDDGHSGLQQMGGDATLLFYGTEEGTEGKNAYLQRRKPDFSRFPRLP